MHRRGIVVGVMVAIAAALDMGGCTRLNPDYCDPAHPCGEGLLCQGETHSCVSTDECALGGCLCLGPEECPSELPDCADGSCQSCAQGAGGDAVCASHDPATPVCLSGGCVACATSSDCAVHGDDAPHCDPLSHTCGPCQDDAECSSGICDEEGGACADPASLIHVDPAGDDGDDCTAAAPCETVGGALEKLEVGRTVIVVHGGGAPFVEAIELDADAIAVSRVDVVGAVGEKPSFVPPPDIAAVTATGAGVAFRLERLELRDGSRAGVVCRMAADLVLVEMVVRDFETLGVDAADDCSLEVHRSQIRGNDGGGVSMIGGTRFILDNDIIALNGYGVASSRGGVVIEDASGTMEFTTVAENRVDSGGRSPGIDCLGDLTLRNSIAWDNQQVDSPDQANVGGTCLHAYSLIGGVLDRALDGGDNVAGDPLFEAGMTFHLGVASAALDQADPAASLPIDIDGQRRPVGDRHDIGADERSER